MGTQQLSRMQICQGFLPVDMSAAANAGDWVSLKNYRKCIVLLYKGAGTAGDDPTITIEQATAVAGTGAKALNAITDVYKKQAASNLLSTGQWSHVEQTADDQYTNDTLAEQPAIVAIEISAEDLDVANGFDCIRASVADVGSNAQLGAMLYLLCEPRTESAPENLLSAIVD